MGINFDPCHTFPIGDFPNITVYRLNKHIKHLHVSDNDGVTNVHWRPGEGKIDWMAMFQALKDVGYDGVVSIELEDVPGVSRGPNSNAPGVYRNVTATDEFVAETVAGDELPQGHLQGPRDQGRGMTADGGPTGPPSPSRMRIRRRTRIMEHR